MKQNLRFAVITLAVALGGCASTNGNPKDPFEGFNRGVFTFNDKVDQVALKPAAQAYRAITPTFVQIGVANFFGNLGDVWTGVNNVLQGKVGDGVSDFMRFAVNSVLGLGGVLDISSEAGLPKHKEDFGQTLGKWGVASGPYVVLPLLGSSTLRDTAALPLDFKGDLWSYKDPVNVRNIGTGVRLLDARAAVLDASDLIEGAALDRYEFVRDAYLQRRESRVNDGEARRSKGNSTAPGHKPDSARPGKDMEKDSYVPAGPTPEAPADGKPVDGKPADGMPAAKPGMKSSAIDRAQDVASDKIVAVPAEPVVLAVVRNEPSAAGAEAMPLAMTALPVLQSVVLQPSSSR